MSDNQDSTQNDKSKSRDIPTASGTFQAASIPASPPRFISVEQLMDASNLLANIKLAHDISVDDNFELAPEQPPEGSLEKRVAETMRRAFWDMLAEQLAQEPPEYSQALSLIQDIKQMLSKCILPHQHSLRNHINEVMDLQLIKQKIENDAFDISYYANFTIDFMGRMCAPCRSERVAKLKELTDVVSIFREILAVLEVMVLDMANFTISVMRPHIKQQSVTYERSKFEEVRRTQEAAGIDGLEYTREWLERSYDVVEDHVEGQAMYGTTLTDVQGTPVNVLHGAYIELLNWEHTHYPETCLVDQERFMQISYNLRKLTLTSSVLLVALSAPADRLSSHTQFRDKLKADILAILSDVAEAEYKEKVVNISEHLALEVNKQLQVLGHPQLTQQQLTEYQQSIRAVVEPNHAVYSLLRRRIMTFIFQSLGHSSSQPLQLPGGIGAVSDDIASYCGKFLKLCSYNKAVFGATYSDIIASLMNMTDLSPRTK